MKSKAETVIETALELPENDRAHIIERLLRSLDDEDEADVDAAWALELDRRAQELDEGLTKPLSWEEVKEYAERRVREGR